MIVALAGGVGAAKMLRGLIAATDASGVVAVLNTGDDVVLHGLHISPDLDTVTYTLAGAINDETGWGLQGETWAAMDALTRYSAELTWFRLGDRDLATHLYRTQRLRDGASLSMVTGEIASAWNVRLRLLPMTDDRIETRVELVGEGEVGFQEYFVRHHHSLPARAVRYAGANAAQPAPGVLESLTEASVVLICPSNPILSIAPILAVPGVRAAVEKRRDATIAVSPIVGGAAIKGPADRLLRELGHESSVVGVARIYASLAATLVIDDVDEALAAAVEAEGMRCIVTPTIMRGPGEAAALARVCLDAVVPS